MIEIVGKIDNVEVRRAELSILILPMILILKRIVVVEGLKKKMEAGRAELNVLILPIILMKRMVEV
jgi:hypothetical protein